MLEIALAPAPHQYQIAMPKRQVHRRAAGPPPHAEHPSGTQTQGRNHRSEAAFVIGVPAHAVPTVPIAIRQYEIERDPKTLTRHPRHAPQWLGPACAAPRHPAVAVLRTRIAMTRRQARLVHLAAEHPDARTAPIQLGQAVIEQATGLSRRDESRQMQQVMQAVRSLAKGNQILRGSVSHCLMVAASRTRSTGT